MVELNGAIERYIGDGELGGRGPGVDIVLHNLDSNAMWLIESALASAERIGASSDGGTDGSVEDGADIVAAERELIESLREELKGMQDRTPHQVLQVSPADPQEVVRKAFAEMTKRYHPDQHAHLQSAVVRELAADIFILVRNAYEQLSLSRKYRSTNARSPLNASVKALERNTNLLKNSSGGLSKPANLADDSRPLTADLLFGDNGGGNQSQVATPVQLSDGPQRDSSADVARALAMAEAGKLDEAQALFSIMAKKSPKDKSVLAGVELVEGLRALRQRDRLEAAERFEAVLDIDPTNERAAKELAEMRRASSNQRKGLLKRLLGGES